MWVYGSCRRRATAGKAPGWQRGIGIACALLPERSFFARKEECCLIRHDLAVCTSIMPTYVCPHVRWVSQPRVVISKTPGMLRNDPKQKVCLHGSHSAGDKINTAQNPMIQIDAVDGESVRRSCGLRRITLLLTVAKESGICPRIKMEKHMRR